MTPPFDYENARELRMSADDHRSDPFPDFVVSAGEARCEVADVVVGGHATAERLAKIGIVTATDLVRRCATPAGRTEVSEATGFSEEHLFAWAATAELLRIPGVTAEFAVMLAAVGAGSLSRLRARQADRLADAMLALTAERSRTGLIPSAAVVGGWIRHAERLSPLVIEESVPDSRRASE